MNIVAIFRKFQKPAAHIGDTAYVSSGGLTKDTTGEITCGGNILKAKLVSDASIERLEAGVPVTIVDTSGGTLLVVPQS